MTLATSAYHQGTEKIQMFRSQPSRFAQKKLGGACSGISNFSSSAGMKGASQISYPCIFKEELELFWEP